MNVLVFGESSGESLLKIPAREFKKMYDEDVIKMVSEEGGGVISFESNKN